MTDKYDPLKDGFTVVPGMDGSFIVHGIVADNPRLYAAPSWGFSNYGDLVKWLQKHDRPKQQPHHRVDTLKEELMRKAADRAVNGSEKPIALPAPADHQPAKSRRGFRFGL